MQAARIRPDCDVEPRTRTRTKGVTALEPENSFSPTHFRADRGRVGIGMGCLPPCGKADRRPVGTTGGGDPGALRPRTPPSAAGARDRPGPPDGRLARAQALGPHAEGSGPGNRGGPRNGELPAQFQLRQLLRRPARIRGLLPQQRRERVRRASAALPPGPRQTGRRLVLQADRGRTRLPSQRQSGRSSWASPSCGSTC
jgi:hypothetical protein